MDKNKNYEELLKKLEKHNTEEAIDNCENVADKFNFLFGNKNTEKDNK